MLEVILGFGFLFNPMGFMTPGHGIEVIHFGHVVRLAAFDEAFDKAAEPWKNDPLWSWTVNLIPSSTRVMVAPFYATTAECRREVEWSVVQTTGSLSPSPWGYTVVISPRVLDTNKFDTDLQTAFSKMFQIVAMRSQPTSYLFPGCVE
ncbi:MAG: hypothetical protein HYX72_00470 [Acidobacteria bacterium]|nr:hypothetical protein [Acidobacteriota bacterium]